MSAACYEGGMHGAARQSGRTGTTLVSTIAAALKAAMEAVGWTEHELAERAGTSQSSVCRVLAGEPSAMRLDRVGDIADALGVRLRSMVDQPFRVGAPIQHDLVHARACAYIGRRLIERGWTVRQEVEIGRPVRGWIDTLAYREADAALFATEFKSEHRDAGAIQRSLGWYEREAWHVARELGWRPRVLGSALLLLFSSENDEAVAQNRDYLAQACPGRATDLARWLDSPFHARPGRSLALIDPISRRRSWLRSTRSDGRRTEAPYHGYADCAQALVAGRRS